jgi:hypothetical protein
VPLALPVRCVAQQLHLPPCTRCRMQGQRIAAMQRQALPSLASLLCKTLHNGVAHVHHSALATLQVDLTPMLVHSALTLGLAV